jgi:hypothetical protein
MVVVISEEVDEAPKRLETATSDLNARGVAKVRLVLGILQQDLERANWEIFPFGMATEMLETMRNPKFCFLK